MLIAKLIRFNEVYKKTKTELLLIKTSRSQGKKDRNEKEWGVFLKYSS